jgi:GT2 family glycosyltransferase
MPSAVARGNHDRDPDRPLRTLVAVVLNWCAEEDSTRAIGSLLAESTPGLTVLLVDNASPDGSGPRLASRHPQLPYLQTGANLGYAGGNQRAIAWALERGADAVLLMNDDAELRPGCLAALRATMEAAPAMGACAPTLVFAPPHDTRVWWAGGDFVAHRAVGTHRHLGAALATLPPADDPVPVSALCGCVVLLRARALREVGGLREAFFAYAEDTELSVRLARGGWHMAWVPGAVAVHHLPFPEPAPSPWAITQRDRNRRLLARLHLQGGARARFRAWYYPTRLLLVARYLAMGDRARAAAVWRGMTVPLPATAGG